MEFADHGEEFVHIASIEQVDLPLFGGVLELAPGLDDLITSVANDALLVSGVARQQGVGEIDNLLNLLAEA